MRKGLENIIESSNIDMLKKIGKNNIIKNCTFVGENIVIGNNCTLDNVVVGEGTNITDSHIVNSLIGKNANIGPFTRIRGNSNIGDNCRLGNFGEINHGHLGEGVKVAHLCYIGDAIIGNNTNVGCGVVFANYNGKTKNVSVVGKDCFIGSNSTIIAPIKIADDTYICAGTVVNKSTNNGDFVIGRVRQEVKDKYSYYKRNKLK